MDKKPDKKPWKERRTIKSLRLDTESAIEGKTWKLLPEGFRAQECGKTYPLPSNRDQLQKLAAIYIPLNKIDSGCIYLRRAMKEWKNRQRYMQSAILESANRERKVADAQQNFNRLAKEAQAKVKEAVDGVREEAEKASASLKDLFALGRKGLESQMKAHLAGEEWQGEKINAKGFRECFAMVTSAVKGLGIPSDQKVAATEAIIEEVAEALKGTREAVLLAPGTEDVEH